VKGAKVVIRHGANASNSKPGCYTPFTRPGESGRVSDAAWVDATAAGVDVRDSSGNTLGGVLSTIATWIFGPLKGTGNGVDGSVFYRPESWPNMNCCPSGLTSDVALMHELLHAFRFANGAANNTPFPTGSADASNYGVQEEFWVVQRENAYRANRSPALRARICYLKDC
jgi:hypothetical protein